MGIAIYSGTVKTVTDKEIILNVFGIGEDKIPLEAIISIQGLPFYSKPQFLGKEIHVFYHYGLYELRIINSEQEKIQSLINTKAYKTEKNQQTRRDKQNGRSLIDYLNRKDSQ